MQCNDKCWNILSLDFYELLENLHFYSLKYKIANRTSWFLSKSILGNINSSFDKGIMK